MCFAYELDSEYNGSHLKYWKLEIYHQICILAIALSSLWEMGSRMVRSEKGDKS